MDSEVKVERREGGDKEKAGKDRPLKSLRNLNCFLTV